MRRYLRNSIWRPADLVVVSPVITAVRTLVFNCKEFAILTNATNVFANSEVCKVECLNVVGDGIVWGLLNPITPSTITRVCLSQGRVNGSSSDILHKPGTLGSPLLFSSLRP